MSILRMLGKLVKYTFYGGVVAIVIIVGGTAVVMCIAFWSVIINLPPPGVH